MDGIGSAEPIGRPERGCQLGRGQVHRPEVESTEKRAQLVELVDVSVTKGFRQELRDQ